MRKFEMRMEESMAMHAPPPQLMDENGMLLSGDTIIGADGQVVTPGEDKTPGHAHLGASLLELYEAQALAVNPFLRAPEELAQEATETIGPHAIAAILLDHLTGLAAVSFVKKATESGLLSAEEGKSLGAIVSLAPLVKPRRPSRTTSPTRSSSRSPLWSASGVGRPRPFSGPMSHLRHKPNRSPRRRAPPVRG